MSTKIAELLPDPETKRVVAAVRRSSSGYFVRDGSRVAAEIARLLVEIRWANSHMRTEPAQERSWAKHVEKLFSLLDGPAPAYRVRQVVRWYRDQPGWREDRYIPRVDSGRSLLEKFDRLETAMLERTGSGRPEETPAEVMSRILGPGGRTDDLERLLPAARNLRLGGDEASLAAALATLYAAVRDARVAANLPRDVRRQLGGPLDLIRQYLSWVHDRDWTATLKVLAFDSPSFTQFRRECARDDAVRRDPVTGRS